jgi:hypothetical protein
MNKYEQTGKEQSCTKRLKTDKIKLIRHFNNLELILLLKTNYYEPLSGLRR